MERQAEAIDDSSLRRPWRADLVPIALAAAVFAVLSALAGIVSEGFLEADGCVHYLYARFALADKHFLTNVWGRPVCTVVYAIPAALGGLQAVRLTSLGLALGCALVAYRIAVNQGYRRPALAFIFTLAQPLVFLHSFSELTELPFALLLGLAFLAYQSRQWLAMALLAGLLPLSRPEGFGFLLMAAAGLVLHRRAWWLLVLPVPLALWNHYGWVFSGKPGPWGNWLIDNWPYAGESLYASGSILHFVGLLPAVVSPLIFPATVVGAGIVLREARRHEGTWDKARRHEGTKARSGEGGTEAGSAELSTSCLPPPSSLRAFVPSCLRASAHACLRAFSCDVLILALPTLILVGHSLLYWLGKMASSGEMRYLLIVAPFWALLSARGWSWLWDRLGWRRPYQWAGLAALAPVVVNGFYTVVPMALSEDWHVGGRIVEWYEKSSLRTDYPRLASAHPAMLYFMDVSPTDGSRLLEWRRDLLLKPPPGVLLVWDPVYGVYNADQQRSVKVDELLAAGWVPDPGATPMLMKGWKVFRSPLTIRGQATSAPTTRGGDH